MAEQSFKLESGDNQMIQNQIQVIRNLVGQRNQLIQQINREVDFMNTVFRAAAAEAKVSGILSKEIDIPKQMLDQSGNFLVNINDGIASWTFKQGITPRAVIGPTVLQGEGEKDEESENG